MIFFGLAIIMALIISFKDFQGFYFEFEDVIWLIVEFIVLIIFYSIIALGLCLVIGLPFKSHFELQETKQLVSINNNYGQQGSYFIGTGFTEGKQYYYYMEKTKDGYKPGKLEIDDNVLIKEIGKNAIMQTYTKWFNKEWVCLIAVPGLYVRYIFIVPKNTIKHHYYMQ